MSTGTADQQADHGWHAVEACSQAAAADQTADSPSVSDGAAHRLIRDTFKALAHLCDRCGIDPIVEIEDALGEYIEDSAGDDRLVPLTLFAEQDSFHTPWSHVPRPNTARQPHRDTVMDMLIAAGDSGITTTELRDRGVKNPANVVLTLIRAGQPIARINEHPPNQHGGHTRYIYRAPANS